MEKLRNTYNVTQIALKLLDAEFELTPYEALDIATKIEYNNIITEAYVVKQGQPSALEGQAMALDSLADIGNSLQLIADILNK